MTAWCRDHPGSDFIPAFATGHDVVFDWRCRGSTPEISRQLKEIDARGFIADEWKQAR